MSFYALQEPRIQRQRHNYYILIGYNQMHIPSYRALQAPHTEERGSNRNNLPSQTPINIKS